MNIQWSKPKSLLVSAIGFAVLLGLFFQNCSGQMASFTQANSSVEVGSPTSNFQPTAEEQANGGTNSSGGATGSSVVDCASNKEDVGGVCVDKCVPTQERFNGKCVNKCASTEFRSADGVCKIKCSENEEIINNSCTAKCEQTKERVNGICIDKCAANEDRINGYCVARCQSTEERINGTCVARCESSQERINGVCTAKCLSDQERINGTCVATCPAGAPRGTNGQCGAITKGVPAFVTIYGIQNATACGENEKTVPLISNSSGIATYRLESSPLSCISPIDTPVEIKYNVADGRCLSGCHFNFQYTDNYQGAVARILPMLSTLQNDNYAPGTIFSAKNLYYHSSVPAKDEIKCQVNLRSLSAATNENYDGHFIMKKANRVIAPQGNGYGTTPTLYTSSTIDKSFHMYSIEWKPDLSYERNNPDDWIKVSPKLSNVELERSHFMIYQNDGELLGGSVVLGLDRVVNQYNIDQQRLFSKIIGQWFFERLDLKPSNLTKERMMAALDQINGVNQVQQIPFMMTVTCPQSLIVYKVREPQ